MSAARGSSGLRWPILVVVLVALVAGVVAQRQRDHEAQAVVVTSPTLLMPTASGPATLSSTWYCAAGSATGRASGMAEQTVIVQNSGRRDLNGRITVMTDNGKSASRSIAVSARDQIEVRVSDLIKADFASAMVEMDGGEVAVSHLLTGPTGSAVAACSSAPSASWFVPAGTTRPGTHELLALFNPFPSDALATVTFATDDGVRTPEGYDAVVVPGGQVTVLDVTPVVTLRTELAATITVREGRLIVDQLQTADGTAGTAKGMSVTPGAPRGASTWWFADGPATQGAKTTFVVQNVGSSAARVSLQVRLDNAAQNGTASPFTATVQPGAYWVIDLSKDTRVPVGVGFTAVARSAGGQPIAVERMVTALAPAQPNGFDLALGSPLVARRWLIPLGSSGAIDKATLIVTNLSASHQVSVSVSTVTGGRLAPLGGTDAVEIIPAGGRGGFTVAAGTAAPLLSIEVDARDPVVVEERLSFPKWGVSSPLAVPVVG